MGTTLNPQECLGIPFDLVTTYYKPEIYHAVFSGRLITPCLGEPPDSLQSRIIQSLPGATALSHNGYIDSLGGYVDALA